MTNRYTIGPHDLNSEANVQNFIMEKFLNSKAFITLGIVKDVRPSDENEMCFIDAQPMIHDQDGSGNLLERGTVFNIPVWRLQSGASAVIMDPKVGDIGLMLCCDKDSRTVRDSLKPALPASGRNHSLGDAVYLGGLLNMTPIQYLRFKEDGIDIVSPLVVNVSAEMLSLNAESKIALNSPQIELNGNVSQGAGSNQGNVTFQGNLTAAGEITAKGIELSTHVHGGVELGDSTTKEPK